MPLPKPFPTALLRQQTRKQFQKRSWKPRRVALPCPADPNQEKLLFLKQPHPFYPAPPRNLNMPRSKNCKSTPLSVPLRGSANPPQQRRIMRGRTATEPSRAGRHLSAPAEKMDRADNIYYFFFSTPFFPSLLILFGPAVRVAPLFSSSVPRSVDPARS